ncbi:BTAD domain-containing putative transcriptional regulator [Streptomyces sp. NPDC002788]
MLDGDAGTATGGTGGNRPAAGGVGGRGRRWAAGVAPVRPGAGCACGALADLPDRSAVARLEAIGPEAVRARAEARLRLGRAQDVVPEPREMTAVHPCDEPLRVPPAAELLAALVDKPPVVAAPGAQGGSTGMRGSDTASGR